MIRDVPAPRNSKEVKQFLDLAGYYRKFVPRFADLSRPLARLTCKDRVFEWTHECKKVFDILKQSLGAQSILKYTDMSKGYTLYTDASKYRWAGVLTQAHTSMVEGKSITTDHPVAYVSGLFRGSCKRLFTLNGSSLLCIRSARCSLGNVCERLCASRPLLGSYVHQESIYKEM